MVRVVCDDTSPLLDAAHCGVAFPAARTNGELAAPTPSASFDGGISQLVLHVENGILETFLLMCGTSGPARDHEHARCARCCCCCAALLRKAQVQLWRDLPLDVRNVWAGSGPRARSVRALLLLLRCAAAYSSGTAVAGLVLLLLLLLLLVNPHSTRGKVVPTWAK